MQGIGIVLGNADFQDHLKADRFARLVAAGKGEKLIDWPSETAEQFRAIRRAL